MNFWLYTIAAVLSLPQYFVLVYLGDLLGSEANGVYLIYIALVPILTRDLGEETSKEKIINGALLVVNIIITIVANVWFEKRVNKVKPEIVYQRRKDRCVFATIGIIGVDQSNDNQASQTTCRRVWVVGRTLSSSPSIVITVNCRHE